MAICTSCQQEMHDKVGCTKTAFQDFDDNQPRQRIPFGTEVNAIGKNAENCPDCLVPCSALHHPGCDIEQCPRCNGQAVTCGCAVQFRPTKEALLTVLSAYRDTRNDSDTSPLVFTDVYALGEYPVTSVFHWPKNADPLGWWFFAEELHISQEILRISPVRMLTDKDPTIKTMLELPEGKKAFREGNSSNWFIRDID
jgi:hypothetical protein